MYDSGAVAYYRPPTREPGDAQPPGRDDMGVSGSRSVEVRRNVLIRIEGRWQAGVLSEWRLLSAGYWVANVRWRDDPQNPAEGWGWFRYDPATLKQSRGGSSRDVGLTGGVDGDPAEPY